MVWGSSRLAAEKLWIIATAERAPRGTSPGRPGPPAIEKKSGPPDVLIRNRPNRLTGSNGRMPVLEVSLRSLSVLDRSGQHPAQIACSPISWCTSTMAFRPVYVFHKRAERG